MKRTAYEIAREIDLLDAAFQQGGWKIECLPITSAQPNTFEIRQFDLLITRNSEGPVGLLKLHVQTGKEVVRLDEMMVGRVFLENRLGVPNDEPRRFTILLCNLSKDELRRAKTGVGFLRKVKGKGVAVVFVRDKNAPPGWPLYKNAFHSSPYGFEEHLRRYGSGDNLLRTERIVQPQALKAGDVLGTGDRVLSEPRRGYNSSVLIHITGGIKGCWIDVAPRLPIALLTKEDNAPKEMYLR